MPKTLDFTGFFCPEASLSGKENGIVRQETVPMLTVYVLWSSITSLLTLVRTKGKFILNQFSISENEFLDYGFKQLINSILEVRI